MADPMRRRRYKTTVILILFASIIFGQYVLRQEQLDGRADDQAAVTDWLAERDAIQAELIADNERLLIALAEETAQREADRLAFEMRACLYGNHAKRVARADADVAITTLIVGLRMSPHAELADQLEADIRARMSTAATSDHDCDGSGVVGDAGDYPP